MTFRWIAGMWYASQGKYTTAGATREEAEARLFALLCGLGAEVPK